MVLHETIRRAREEDVDQVLHLEKQFLDRAFKRKEFTKRLDSEQFMVLEVEGVVVGYYILLNRKASRVHRIYSICVDKGMQNRGYGKALMRHIIDRCGPGAKIKLEVDWNDSAVKTFYTKLGFNYTKLLMNYYGPDHDAVEMVYESA